MGACTCVCRDPAHDGVMLFVCMLPVSPSLAICVPGKEHASTVNVLFAFLVTHSAVCWKEFCNSVSMRQSRVASRAGVKKIWWPLTPQAKALRLTKVRLSGGKKQSAIILESVSPYLENIGVQKFSIVIFTKENLCQRS